MLLPLHAIDFQRKKGLEAQIKTVPDGVVPPKELRDFPAETSKSAIDMAEAAVIDEKNEAIVE